MEFVEICGNILTIKYLFYLIIKPTVMLSILRYIIVLMFLTILMQCTETINPNYEADTNNPAFLHNSIDRLTEVMVHDIFSPPVASRVYFYPNLAAYETLIQGNPTYKSMKGQLNGFKGISDSPEDKAVNLPLAAIHAYLKMAEELAFSKDSIRVFEAEIMEAFKAIQMPSEIFENSIQYGDKVYQAISNYASKDNYKESRTFPTYTISKAEGKWSPTPPAYMDAVEPYWNTIRPLTLDSAQQYKPAPPTPFDRNENSTFYKEMLEVYEVTQNLTDEQQLIAAFWDCNPFAVKQTGHVMTSVKKITPGGHWMGIAGIAAKSNSQDLVQTSATYLMTSIALFDAFISCWDEKYRSNLIRPETIINASIDPEWKPLLQTPPFPEYTSGHSVISAAAATVLTKLYGNNFQFTDDTEVPYGLPTRDYTSFFEASNEAAISRLYGGIHYRPACMIGVEQGKGVGEHILRRLNWGQ